MWSFAIKHQFCNPSSTILRNYKLIVKPISKTDIVKTQEYLNIPNNQNPSRTKSSLGNVSKITKREGNKGMNINHKQEDK